MMIVLHNQNFSRIMTIFILSVMEVTTDKYNPISLLEYGKSEQKLTIDYTEEDTKNNPVHLYCVTNNMDQIEHIHKSTEPKEYISINNLNDENIPKIALIIQGFLKKNLRWKCSYPVIIAREKHILFTNSLYSLYGFYVQVNQSSKWEHKKNEKSEHTFISIYRNINGKDFSFMELYSSADIDDEKRTAKIYSYMLPTNNVHRYTTEFNIIVQSMKENNGTYSLDECSGLKIDHIFTTVTQETFFDNFLETVTENRRKETFTQYKNMNYLRLRFAYLVPPIHLLFNGYESLRGNCTMVAVWDTIYEYLLEVDKAIFDYVKRKERNAYIKTGYSNVLENHNGDKLVLPESNHGIIAPHLVWKRVQFRKLRTRKDVDMELSFAVTITNDIFQNENDELSPFRKVKAPCEYSCSTMDVNVLKQTEKRVKQRTPKPKVNANEESKGKSVLNKYEEAGIVKCCRLNESNWNKFEQSGYVIAQSDIDI